MATKNGYIAFQWLPLLMCKSIFDTLHRAAFGTPGMFVLKENGDYEFYSEDELRQVGTSESAHNSGKALWEAYSKAKAFGFMPYDPTKDIIIHLDKPEFGEGPNQNRTLVNAWLRKRSKSIGIADLMESDPKLIMKSLI